MDRLLPSAFLFRFALPISYYDSERKSGSGVLTLPKSAQVAMPSALDGGPDHATLLAGWNEGGFAVAAVVTGKQHPPQCDVSNPTEADGLQVWIDTRNTQSIHRASRFCHHFCALPSGFGRRKNESVVVQVPIARAKEDAPQADPKSIPVSVSKLSDGYRIDVWLPASVLHGFDPEANPRLGFYACVKDREFGDQPFSVGPEFPYDHDPSLWSTVELIRE